MANKIHLQLGRRFLDRDIYKWFIEEDVTEDQYEVYLSDRNIHWELFIIDRSNVQEVIDLYNELGREHSVEKVMRFKQLVENK